MLKHLKTMLKMGASRLSERRGLREIAVPPSVAQLTDFVKRKELRGELYHVDLRAPGKAMDLLGRTWAWHQKPILVRP